jgi:hypothetical protein
MTLAAGSKLGPCVLRQLLRFHKTVELASEPPFFFRLGAGPGVG